MAEITTLKIKKETKERLDKLKEHERETYDQIIRKLLFILNISKKNPEKAKNFMNRIDRINKSKKPYTEVYSKEGKDEEDYDDKN